LDWTAEYTYTELKQLKKMDRQIIDLFLNVLISAVPIQKILKYSVKN